MTDDTTVNAGSDAQANAPDPTGAPTAAAHYTDKVRQLIMQIGQLSQRVPEAQPEFQAAAKALTMAQMKMAASQEPNQQPGGAMPVGT